MTGMLGGAVGCGGQSQMPGGVGGRDVLSSYKVLQALLFT